MKLTMKILLEKIEALEKRIHELEMESFHARWRDKQARELRDRSK